MAVANCQEHPHIPRHVLQIVLRERSDVFISIGYLNQVRSALGIQFIRPTATKTVTAGADRDTLWQDGAGSLLLLAVTQETSLITTWLTALPA